MVELHAQESQIVLPRLLAEGEGHEDEHRWAVLRTGPADAFLRSFDQLADF